MTNTMTLYDYFVVAFGLLGAGGCLWAIIAVDRADRRREMMRRRIARALPPGSRWRELYR